MTPYFTEVLMTAPNSGTLKEEEACAREFIDLLTGKQTIYQCIRLNDEVVKRLLNEYSDLIFELNKIMKSLMNP